MLKAIQLLRSDGFVSRSRFSKELRLGEGAVKTLILHLKDSEIAGSMRSGTYLTDKGSRLARRIFSVIANECSMAKSPLLDAENNHAILLRGYESAIRSGVEQRDYSIMYGAKSAVTLLFRGKEFVFPSVFNPALQGKQTGDMLADKLKPKDGDVVIIASAEDPFISEIAAKHAALCTIASHNRH